MPSSHVTQLGEARPGGEAGGEPAHGGHGAAGGAGRVRRQRRQLLEERAQRADQRVARIGALEQRERLAPFALVEVVPGRLAEQVDRVRHLVGLVERAALQRPREHEQTDEDQVDQRGGRPVEVVVVLGHELAELVDEEAEADPADDRRRPPHAPAEEGQQQADRDQHEHPAPQQMGDVQPAAAELRVVRQPQLRPDHQDRRDAGDQQRLVQRPEVDRPRAREAQPPAHGVTAGAYDRRGQPRYPASARTIRSWSAYAGDSIRSGGTNSSGIPFIITANANVLPLTLVQ